jgi:FkbM family methyltransferase
MITKSRVSFLLKLMRHPTILTRKIVGKLGRQWMTTPNIPVVQELHNGVRFEHRFEPFLNEDDYRAMLNGSYDIILQDFLKTHLSSGDIFIDAGANVGYITAIAASYLGTAGEVHSFEPLKECFFRLKRLQELNPSFKFYFNNTALGNTDGRQPICFNPDHDSRDATLVPGQEFYVTREVPVRRLDDYIFSNISAPERIKVIKIDVEGFEFPVLLGLERFLQKYHPLIVCEFKPWELPKLGYTVEQFEQYMHECSYEAYDIIDTQTKVSMRSSPDFQILLFKVTSAVIELQSSGPRYRRTEALP